MQKYTYSPSLVVQCGNSTYCYPTIVDACSSYVGTKGLYIQKNSTETGFIPFVATSCVSKSIIRVEINSSTTCALGIIYPQITVCATACSVAYKSDSYDPGQYNTYIKNFKVCLHDSLHSNCPYALRGSYCVCLYDSINGWKYMTTLTCNSNCATASTYQFSNACVSQWRTLCVYIFYSSTSCDCIGNIKTYMPTTSAGRTYYCTTNCTTTTLLRDRYLT